MLEVKQQSYTVTEAAAIVGVRRETIHRWINNGDVKTVRVGDGFQRISESEIKRMLGE